MGNALQTRNTEKKDHDTVLARSLKAIYSAAGQKPFLGLRRGR